jgi:transcriptional regulator with XRE-family HTH domain
MVESFLFLAHDEAVNQLYYIDQAFGRILRKRRLQRSLTQEALSLAYGLSRAYISELEMGRKDPSLYTIFRLATALKMKPSVFIDEIEHQF